MIRTLFIILTLAFAPPAFAQDHNNHDQHKDGEALAHDNHDHGAHEHEQSDHSENMDHKETKVVLTRTPEITAALDMGGEPVVVEVLGVVCDFCAKAMNKTFGRRDEVSAVHVDLDTKTLNLVLVAEGALTDEEIKKGVVRAGYKTKAIHRGEHLLGEANAPDPS